jgi:hypothetical protein
MTCEVEKALLSKLETEASLEQFSGRCGKDESYTE